LSTHTAGSAATDALFDKELKKYEPLRADVARNVARNEELLAAVSRDSQVGSGGLGTQWGTCGRDVWQIVHRM
jgi:hypothetical protein